MENQVENIFLKAYEDFSDPIFRHCYFRVSNKELAEDMVQNVFIKAWGYIEKGNQVKNIRALLYKIANDLIIDEYRKKKAVSLDNLTEQGFDFSSGENRAGTERSLEANNMLKLLDQLEGKYREAVVMRYINELSPKEIAEIIGETENNVSVRINRAIKQLRDILDHA